MDDKILRKQYRFQKQNLFNEEVFKIKLEYYLGEDLEQCATTKVFSTLEMLNGDPITLEKVKTWADKIYSSEAIVSNAESNLDFTKECENYDEWENNCEIDLEVELDYDVGFETLLKLFPNTIEFLMPYGLIIQGGCL
jgi:hypothetical protein